MVFVRQLTQRADEYAVQQGHSHRDTMTYNEETMPMTDQATAGHKTSSLLLVGKLSECSCLVDRQARERMLVCVLCFACTVPHCG